MTKLKSLPTTSDLRKLAYGIDTFPISDLSIIQFAEHNDYSEELVEFLKLFYREMVFHSRAEFLNYCGLLERLIIEGQRSPPEHLLSP